MIIRLLLIIACSQTLNAFAQFSPEQIKQYMEATKLSRKAGLTSFYTLFGNKAAWIGSDNTHRLNYLLDVLDKAGRLGLRKEDYQFSLVESIRNRTINLKGEEDSLSAETKLTDAALHFFHDIAFGNTIPEFYYDGLRYDPDCREIAAALADYVSNDKLDFLITDLSPKLPEIKIIGEKIEWMMALQEDSRFEEVVISSRIISAANKPLVQKLVQLGMLDPQGADSAESTLKRSIQEANVHFNLPVASVLSTSLLKELNQPLKTRIKQLSLSINYYRWLHCLMQDRSIIVVNLPAAYLKVYNNNRVILEMRLIVGQKSTPSFTLTSRVSEIILYPYWYVPKKIATRELLPIIKRYPGFLYEGNYQVLDGKGRIIEPYSINWNALSTSYFPYTLRQSTGCDNSLGILKLNFYNPMGVYLHDTPSKNLFRQYRRFYSHGCMRMEKPMEMGRLILKENSVAIDTLEEKGCLPNQRPISVPAVDRMPVVVWYNPAGVDSTGRVIFYEDIYQRFNWKSK